MLQKEKCVLGRQMGDGAEEGSWFGKAEVEVGPASVFISRDLGSKEARVDRYYLGNQLTDREEMTDG